MTDIKVDPNGITIEGGGSLALLDKNGSVVKAGESLLSELFNKIGDVYCDEFRVFVNSYKT